MKSIDAKIIEIKDRLITICIPEKAVAGLVGKEIQINGLKAIWVQSVPSKEAEDDKPEMTDALAYRLTGEDDIGSLVGSAICEVTWD